MRARGTSPLGQHQPALRSWMVRGLAAALAAAVAVLAPVTPATAYWGAAGNGEGAASTGRLNPPTEVLAMPSDHSSVEVNWTASGELSPTSYFVVRIGDAGAEPACGSTAAVPIAATSCLDESIAAGTYRYRVIAVHRSWTSTSDPSAPVTVEEDGFLGAATSFSVLGVDATMTAPSSVSGDLGVTPMGAVVGFSATDVGGVIHVNDPAAAAAAAALLVAYDDAAARTADSQFPGDPNGMVFHPGVHHTIGAMSFTGTVTLDALGDPNAIFIFQVNGAITGAANSHIALVNGATASNVYWQVNGASGHGANSTFAGTIMAVGAITLGAGVELIGRALSQAAVTLGGNVVRFTVESSPTVQILGGGAVVTKDTTPTVSGTTSAATGRPVTISIGSQVLTTTVLAGGTWSVTSAELAAATYPVVVRIRDAAGNNGVAAQQLTVEVNPPTIVLGAAGAYSVLTQANVVGTGTSQLSGELGVSPGSSVTGFPPGTSGPEHLGDASAAAAADAANAAFADGMARIAHTQFGDPSGLVFHTGVHHAPAAVVLTGSITLDAEGDPNAVFIFQIEGALTTAAGSQVVLANGAQASNVFWIVVGAAGAGANSSFAGTILTPMAVTLGNLAQLQGRVLAAGTVTLANNTIAGS